MRCANWKRFNMIHVHELEEKIKLLHKEFEKQNSTTLNLFVYAYSEPDDKGFTITHLNLTRAQFAYFELSKLIHKVMSGKIL